MGTADIAGTAICRMVESLAVAADPARYEIEACFLHDGELSDRLRQTGVKSTCVNWNGSARDLRGAARYAALMRSSEFSIIHQHTGGRLLTGLGRWLTHARIVRHLHGRASERTGIVPPNARLPKSDAMIAVSQIVADFSGNPRAVVINPGIDATRFSKARSTHKGIVIGTACRLEPIKGIEFLIEALALLAPEFDDLRLEIAGDGELRFSLQQHCHRLGVADRVSFLGWREDLPSVMAGWDIFALPSLDEGFPVAALEAMAAGLPVVASAVGGVCEMVIDGETGLLTLAAVPAELASRIRELIGDCQMRKQMGLAGRQRVLDRYSVVQMVKKTIRLYDELLLS
jgi:glycosyltransferase involved in cell wall biosynthesis